MATPHGPAWGGMDGERLCGLAQGLGRLRKLPPDNCGALKQARGHLQQHRWGGVCASSVALPGPFSSGLVPLCQGAAHQA